MAYSEENIKYLQSNLENETIKFSPEQKYSILVRINTSKTISVEEKDSIVKKYLENDTSDLGKYCKLKC